MAELVLQRDARRHCSPATPVRRSALLCANILACQSLAGTLPSAAPVTSTKLRAAIIAKGVPQLAATVEALGKVPRACEADAVTPFAASTSSAAVAPRSRGKLPAKQGTKLLLSPEAAAEQLYQQIVQPRSQLTLEAAVTLFCTAGSPDPQPRAYEQALCLGLADQIKASCSERADPYGTSLWLDAALLHERLYAAADGDAELAAVMLGSGATEEAYIRWVCRLSNVTALSTSLYYSLRRVVALAFYAACCTLGAEGHIACTWQNWH